MVERILFLGDLTRGDQAPTVAKMFLLLGPVLRQVGVTCETHYSAVNLVQAREHWLAGWRAAILNNDISGLEELDLDCRTAVIGFELPDRYCRYFNEREIAWMTLAIHPLRFLSDLHFDIRASFSFDASPLTTGSVEIEYSVNALRMRHGALFDGTRKGIAIFGQTPHDAGVFFDGDFRSLDYYVDTIDRLVAQHDLVIYKPHPYLTNAAVDAILRDRYNAQLYADRNAYKLLAGGVSEICAISSSILVEGEAFGLRSTFLEPRARRAGPPINYRRLLDHPEVWTSGLLRLPLTLSGPPISDAIPENMLRESFGYWGFTSRQTELEEQVSHIIHAVARADNHHAHVETRLASQGEKVLQLENDLKANGDSITVQQIRVTDLIEQTAELGSKHESVAETIANKFAAQEAVLADLLAQTIELGAAQKRIAEHVMALASLSEPASKQRPEAEELGLSTTHQKLQALQHSNHYYWQLSEARLKIIQEFRGSTSWRITAPLRLASAGVYSSVGGTMRWVKRNLASGLRRFVDLGQFWLPRLGLPAPGRLVHWLQRPSLPVEGYSNEQSGQAPISERSKEIYELLRARTNGRGV